MAADRRTPPGRHGREVGPATDDAQLQPTASNCAEQGVPRPWHSRSATVRGQATQISAPRGSTPSVREAARRGHRSGIAFYTGLQPHNPIGDSAPRRPAKSGMTSAERHGLYARTRRRRGLAVDPSRGQRHDDQGRPGAGDPPMVTMGELMSDTETITLPHLGGSAIGYRFGKDYDAALPTLVMVNSFSTSVELYRPQFADEDLMAAANLLALEPYGHGQTRASYEQFTYWDSAIANLQVLDALGISEAFVLGTSQGGWVAARMAMLASHAVRGI